jgi:FkbM family methyltransferase
MVVPHPHRLPFLVKLRVSILKRRLRLVRWIGRLRGRKELAVKSRYFGATFGVRLGEIINDRIATNQFEWREISMMIEACREYRPTLFIDVGANIGLYACILGKSGLVPRIIAYEPDRENFARLVENVERNSLTDIVRLCPYAAGAGPGKADLTPGPADNAGLSKIDRTGSGLYSVDVVALDDEIDVRGSAIVIKIDVEGYELEVLAGAARLLGSNAGYAQIEGHGDERAMQITDIMHGHGWRLVDRHGIDLRFERAPPAQADRR